MIVGRQQRMIDAVVPKEEEAMVMKLLEVV